MDEGLHDPRRKQFRRRFRTVAVLLGLLFLVVLALVQSEFADGWLLQNLEQRAASAGIVATASSFRYSLLSRRLELHNVTLAVRGRTPFFKANTIEVTWRYFRLSRGLSAISSVRVTDGTFQMAETADGVSNLDFGTGSSTSTPIGMPEQVTLERMRFLYGDGTTFIAQPGINLTFHDGHWSGGAEQPGTVRVNQVSGTISGVDVQGTETGINLHDLSLQARAGAVDVLFGDNAPAVLDVVAILHGDKESLEFPRIHARSAKGQLNAVGLLPLNETTGSLKLSGDYEHVRVQADAQWTGTDFDTYTANAHLHSVRRDIQGDASLLLNAHTIRARIQQARGYGATASGSIDLNVATDALYGALRGSIPDMGLVTTQQVAGHGAFLASVGGKLFSPDISITARSDDLAAGSFTPVKGMVKARYRSGVVAISDSQLSLQGQAVHAAGKISLQSRPKIDLAITSDALDLSQLSSYADLPVSLAGELRLTGSVSGPLFAPVADLSVTGTSLAMSSQQLGAMDAKILYRHNQVIVDKFLLSKTRGASDGTLQASGTYDTRSHQISTQFQSTQFPLEVQVPSTSDLTKLTLSGDGAFSGPADRLSGSAAIALNDEHGNKLDSTLKANDGFSTLNAHSSLLSVGLPSGVVRGSIDAQATGPLLHPDEFKASAAIKDFSFTAPQARISADGAVEVAWQARTLEVIKANFRNDGDNAGSLDIKGSLGLDPSSDHLHVYGHAPLALVATIQPSMGQFEPAGSLVLDGTVAGTLGDPHLGGVLQLHDGSLHMPQTEEKLHAIEATIRANDGALELQQLSAKFGAGDIAITGSAASLQGPFLAKATFDRIDPTLLFRSSAPQFTSTISGTANVHSLSASLDDVEGTLQVSQLQLQSPAGSALQEHAFEATLKRGVVTLPELAMTSKFGRFSAGGTVDLHGDHLLHATVNGVVDTSVLNVGNDLHLSGPLTANLLIQGSAAMPDIRGEAELHNGAFSLSQPVALNADGVSLHARLNGSSLQLDRFDMNLNGGDVKGSGTYVFAGKDQGGVLHFMGEDVFMNYPVGLQSASDFDLSLDLNSSAPSLTGKITVNDSAYRTAFDITTLTRNTTPSVPGTSAVGLAGRLRLNVAVQTDQPFAVDNNLGRLTSDVDLHVAGTLQHPGLTGGLEFEDGGQINFAGRNFRIDQGRLDFTSANRIEPRLSLQAESTVSNYLITLKLNSDGTNLETNFQSEPSLTQDQILSVLFTGSPDMSGNSSFYAQSQLMSLLGSSVGGGFFTTVRNTLRLNEFRIDPRLIAADKNPTARLTVGEAFTPSFRITYSTDLTNAEDQVWTAEYDWRKRFLARFYRGSDQSNRAEIRQKFRFGGGPLTGDYAQHAAHAKLNIQRVVIEGEPVLDVALIRKALHLKVGQSYDTFRSQRDIGRLRKQYVSRGYAEVRIHSHRIVEGKNVSLTYDIQAGPPLEFIYETKLDSKTKKAVLAKWQEGLSDDQRIAAVEHAIQEGLKAKQLPLATSDVSVHETDGKKKVLIDIQRGSRFRHPTVAVTGVPAGQQAALRNAARHDNTDIAAEFHPEVLTAKTVSQLQAAGYLAANVTTVVDRQSPQDGSLKLAIVPGPRFTVGPITFEGNSHVSADALRHALFIEPGDAYHDDLPDLVATRVQQAYWDAGFREARVTPFIHRDDATGKVNLRITVAEGPQLILNSVTVHGLSETSAPFLNRRLTLQVQHPVMGSSVTQSRRNLLDSGAYNLVDFTFKPSTTPAANSSQQPADLTVTVREPKPVRFDFGATYDTDRGFGGIADVSLINKLGEARTLGFRVTADGQEQDYRLYFSQPFLGRKRILSTASLFAQHQQVSIFDGYDQGLALQQDMRVRKNWHATYGYQFEHVTVDVQNYGQLFNETTSSVIGTVSRDTRDKPLDAAKGIFISAAGEYGPHQLGGSIGYFRAYTQASGYLGLLHPRPLPFEETRRRSRLVLASNVRAGIVNNIGDALLVPTDLFFAGGGTSLRGFSQNSVGPKDSSGNALGGKVTLIFNNEVRFPLYKFVDGVAFVDTGNVWGQLEDVRFTDMRTGAGAGLRIRNPFVLVRFDYGVKINRQAGESLGAFFFSIGQTF